MSGTGSKKWFSGIDQILLFLWVCALLWQLMPLAVHGQLVDPNQDMEAAIAAGSHYQPPMIIKNPGSTEAYSRGSRTGTGVPSIAVTKEGRIWAAWYSGNTPGLIIERCPNAYVVVATSGNGGQTWKEVLVIDPDGPGPLKAYDPLPWVDPDGRLWIIWHHTGRANAWAITTDDPESENPKWSEPRRITDGIMMNKPIILSTGEWLFPVVRRITGEVSSSIAMISADKGKTFHDRGDLRITYDVRPIEPMIVERMDGLLWMLIRTSYGIGESISKDRGVTWSPLTPSAIKHTTSRFFIGRLQSGNLLLVKNGPIDMRTEGPTQRCYMMAFISTDDGKTWSRGLLLDGRAPVSYPDVQQTDDGTIYVIWDFNRSRDQMILMTTFREDDILENNDIKMIEVFQRRKVVSQGGTR